MIKIENTKVVGWEDAIRGMRNPKNSWDRIDSYATHIEDPETLETAEYEYFVGPNDHKLMMTLAKGGPVHAKYRRFIMVYVDITAPLYWWKEADTYRIGVEKNSCSTMHKIHDKEFTLEDFSHEHLISDSNSDYDLDAYLFAEETDGFEVGWSPLSVLEHTIRAMNVNREAYIETKDKRYWWQMIQLLPSSYNQKRTMMISYEALADIYEWRRNHKLDEWREVCEWIESLPYSEIITQPIVEKDNIQKRIDAIYKLRAETTDDSFYNCLNEVIDILEGK